MSAPNDPPPGYRDISIPISDITWPGLVIGTGITALGMIPFWLLHDFKGSLDVSAGTGLLVVAILAVLLIAHEFLHALGWMWAGRFGWDQISFGFDRKTFNPYTHVHTPMTARAYRIGAILPGAVTGVIPVLAGWITGSGPLTLIGVFMAIGAVGDLIILWIIRRVPGDALVLDHPTHAGCWVKDA
jgi:hypothetical protein